LKINVLDIRCFLVVVGGRIQPYFCVRWSTRGLYIMQTCFWQLWGTYIWKKLFLVTVGEQEN